MKYNRYALTLLCSFMMLCFGNRASAQITIVADPTTCGDTAVTLHATLLGDVPTSAGITADDGYSACINIGFTFNYYGNNYTQLCIGSNGVLTFGCTSAGSYCTWPISNTLAGTAAGGTMQNTFCALWSDICTPCATPGGTITYSSIGTAPYRKFMATWCATHMYSCTAQYETFQAILYETTGVLETHIAHRTYLGCTWNGPYAIVGVTNATGTASTVAPGRDWPANWGAINEAWRFTPSGAPTSAYTCSSIPFAPVPYASSTIYWYDSATHVLVGSGPTINVHPTVPTTYVAAAAGCSDSTFAYIHVMPLSGGGSVGTGISAPVHITNLSGSDTIDCGSHTGIITIHGVNPGVPDSIFYSYNGMPQATIVQTSLSDSTLVLTGLAAGVYDYIYVKQGSCISNALPWIIYNSVLVPGFTVQLLPGCTSDQLIVTDQAYSHPSFSADVPISTFDYGDGTGTTSTATHTYTAQGSYVVSQNYHNAYGCSVTATLPVSFSHSLNSVFMPSAPQVCLGVPEIFTNSSVAFYQYNGVYSNNPMTYSWTFGDGSTSTDQSPAHIYAAAGTYSVTLTNTDSIGCTATSSTTIDVISITTTLNVHDTTVCLRLPLQLEATTVVVPSSLTNVVYSWSPTTGLSDPTIPNPTFMTVGDFVYTLSATVLPIGCTASDVVTIHSNSPITLTNVTADATIPYGASIQLNADSAWIFVWSPNDGTLSNPNINNPVATPTDSVNTYMVVGMSPYGCRDSAYVTIRVDQGVTEFVPEAFTPNGDGLNDLFRVYNLHYQKLVDFSVYNRWGHQVFHTIDPKTGWDGTLNGVAQDMGTYYYQIIVAHPDGLQKTITGSVTLIR